MKKNSIFLLLCLMSTFQALGQNVDVKRFHEIEDSIILQKAQKAKNQVLMAENKNEIKFLNEEKGNLELFAQNYDKIRAYQLLNDDLEYALIHPYDNVKIAELISKANTVSLKRDQKDEINKKIRLLESYKENHDMLREIVQAMSDSFDNSKSIRSIRGDQNKKNQQRFRDAIQKELATRQNAINQIRTIPYFDTLFADLDNEKVNPFTQFDKIKKVVGITK